MKSSKFYEYITHFENGLADSNAILDFSGISQAMNLNGKVSFFSGQMQGVDFQNA